MATTGIIVQIADLFRLCTRAISGNAYIDISYLLTLSGFMIISIQLLLATIFIQRQAERLYEQALATRSDGDKTTLSRLCVWNNMCGFLALAGFYLIHGF